MNSLLKGSSIADPIPAWLSVTTYTLPFAMIAIGIISVNGMSILSVVDAILMLSLCGLLAFSMEKLFMGGFSISGSIAKGSRAALLFRFSSELSVSIIIIATYAWVGAASIESPSTISLLSQIVSATLGLFAFVGVTAALIFSVRRRRLPTCQGMSKAFCQSCLKGVMANDGVSVFSRLAVMMVSASVLIAYSQLHITTEQAPLTKQVYALCHASLSIALLFFVTCYVSYALQIKISPSKHEDSTIGIPCIMLSSLTMFCFILGVEIFNL